MEMLDNGFKITHSKMSQAPGIGGWDALDTYPEAMQKKLLKDYDQKYSEEQKKRPEMPEYVYTPPQEYNEHVEHFRNFFDGVRENKPLVEGPEFAFRAAAPTLACNDSYFSKKIINWDPVNMKVIQ
jgi:hypothetical protein